MQKPTHQHDVIINDKKKQQYVHSHRPLIVVITDEGELFCPIEKTQEQV